MKGVIIMKKKLQKLTALFLSIVMLPVIPVSVNAEEPEKNFEYYQSLSDYEVYKEFCDTHSLFDAQETLPAENEMPMYAGWKHYLEHNYIDMSFQFASKEVLYDEQTMTEEEITALFEKLNNPSLYGFPVDWKAVNASGIPENIVDCMVNTDWTVDFGDGMTYPQYELKVHTQLFEKFAPEKSYLEDMTDIYRIWLTIQNSEFIRTYLVDKAEQVSLYAEETPPVSDLYGDLNKDGAVNAADAALILQYAAAVGAGYTGSLENYIEGPSTNVDERVLRGTAYLEGSFNDLEAEDFYLSGDPIYDNAEFSCTWDISGCENFDDADTIALRIEYAHPNPLGKSGEVALTVSEVWLDDVKIEELSGKPLYSCRTDHGFEMDNVTDITFNLRNAVFNDLDMEFSEQVTVIFKLTGLSELAAE